MNPERVNQIYSRLPQLVVDLDPDPAGRGAAYLQDLISRVRGMLNEVGVYLQEVLRVKGDQESELEALTSSFEVASNELLANDDRVTRLPAVQDRMAMINVLLREDYRAILDKRKEVNDIGHVERAVRHRHRELEQTMSAIRLQRSLLQTEIRTGAMYGDENDASRGDSWTGKDDDLDGDEIDRLMAEAEAEETAQATAGVEAEIQAEDEAEVQADEEAEVTAAASEEVQVEDFPDDVSVGDPVQLEESVVVETSGDDLDDFLTSLTEGDISPDDDPMLLCSVCGEPQIDTPSGLVCKNGHGGVPSEPDPEPKPEPPKEKPKSEKPKTKKTTSKPKPVDSDPEEDPDVAAFLDEEDDFADIFDDVEKDDGV